MSKKYDPTSPVPKSTQWARANKEKVKARDSSRRKTLNGKLVNLVTQSKYRAKERGFGHNINTEYLRGLYEGQKGRCAISGLAMTITGPKHTKEGWYSISIDRIDSSKGYVKGNVQLTCTGVNKIKGNMSQDQLLEFCKGIVENLS